MDPSSVGRVPLNNGLLASSLREEGGKGGGGIGRGVEGKGGVVG